MNVQHSKNTIVKKEPSLEEQEKELLYWESQYKSMFEKLEKKNKNLKYQNLMLFNRVNKVHKQ
jgi:hypothetical protein